MASKATCSVCGTKIDGLSGRHASHSNWIGFVRFGKCSWCERDVAAFYDLDKGFMFSLIGTRTHFNSMFAFLWGEQRPGIVQR